MLLLSATPSCGFRPPRRHPATDCQRPRSPGTAPVAPSPSPTPPGHPLLLLLLLLLLLPRQRLASCCAWPRMLRSDRIEQSVIQRRERRENRIAKRKTGVSTNLTTESLTTLRPERSRLSYLVTQSHATHPLSLLSFHIRVAAGGLRVHIGACLD